MIASPRPRTSTMLFQPRPEASVAGVPQRMRSNSDYTRTAARIDARLIRFEDEIDSSLWPRLAACAQTEFKCTTGFPLQAGEHVIKTSEVIGPSHAAHPL